MTGVDAASYDVGVINLSRKESSPPGPAAVEAEFPSTVINPEVFPLTYRMPFLSMDSDGKPRLVLDEIELDHWVLPSV